MSKTGVNLLVLSGTVSKVKSHQLDSGVDMGTCTLLNLQKFQRKNGTWSEYKHYQDCIAFGPRAQLIAGLSEGDEVVFTGSVSSRKREDEWKITMQVESVHVTGNTPKSQPVPVEDDDDIPF